MHQAYAINNNMKKVNKKSKGKKHMDDKGSVNLSGINKTKSKKLIKPVSLKKQKGPKRDDEGKFATTSGVGGLKTAKAFNWKRAFPIIAIITLVGGFFVYQSFAAGPSNPRYNCRIWAKDNGAIFDYVGTKSNVHGIWINTIYQMNFKVAPTPNEKLKWVDRAAELHNSYTSGSWDQKCRVRWEVYKEILQTTPEGLGNRSADQATKSSEVLKTVYADQIIPRGMTNNPYITTIIHTRAGLPIVPIKPYYSSITQRWESGWPEKIKVCAIVYNRRGSPGNRLETKVSMNVSATGQFKKTVVLEQLPNLNAGGGYPKYEICSGTVPKTYTQPATAGRPVITGRPSSVISAGLDMVSIKNPTNPRSSENKTFKWDTSPNEYHVLVEQYQIKKAE